MILVPKEEYRLDASLSVCFTGHRADKLPWGYNEADKRCLLLRERLEKEILRAYENGKRYFLSGMADGFDLYAAEAVLRLKRKCPGMELAAIFPYGTGDTPRKKRIARLARHVVSLHESYSSRCFMERNSFLTEHSAAVIACFSGDESSGTAATLRMAKRRGLEITILCP